MEIIFKLSEQGESEWCLPGLFLMPDLHAVTTLLFDWFRYKSVFISAAFDSLHHLLLSFKLFSPFLFFFFSDETSQLVVCFSSRLWTVVYVVKREH